MKSAFTTNFLWGVYPYFCFLLFVAVPVIRLIYRPFGFTTRASGLFNRDVLGAASLTLHWGLLLLFLAHLAGLIGGLLGLESWVAFFYWAGLIGGCSVLLGSIIALARRFAVPEVKAMSQWDDYLVHFFLIALVGLGLYQVIVDKIFGVAYTASSWFASISQFNPQPALMDSASLLSKWHVFLALTFFALFPFTKLVHLWALPLNYFVRPYQSMRTNRYVNQARWEFGLRSDQSFLIYALAGLVLFFGATSMLLGRARANGTTGATVKQALPALTDSGRLAGTPLYVSQCARCHGLAGKGDGLGANSPTFATLPRDLRTGKYAFVSTENAVASDEDLARTIQLGLVTAGMPAFGELDEAQVRSLVTVVRRFSKAPGEAPGPTIQVPPCPPQVDLKKGQELYLQACAPCHGQAGRGDGPTAASMKDFAGRPARPRDFTTGQFKVSTEPEQIYLRIAAGTPPVMPAFNEAFKPEDIWSIVKFVEAELVSGKMARQMAAAPLTPPPALAPEKPDAGATTFE